MLINFISLAILIRSRIDIYIFLVQSYVEIMLGHAGLGRGYVELRLALCRGVGTDKIVLDISVITMVISVELCLGRTEHPALPYRPFAGLFIVQLWLLLL